MASLYQHTQFLRPAVAIIHWSVLGSRELHGKKGNFCPPGPSALNNLPVEPCGSLVWGVQISSL